MRTVEMSVEQRQRLVHALTMLSEGAAGVHNLWCDQLLVDAEGAYEIRATRGPAAKVLARASDNLDAIIARLCEAFGIEGHEDSPDTAPT
jgi:hypothetical protein